MEIDPLASRLTLLRMLTGRMERLSMDSLWARRASGVRRSLIKALEQADAGDPPDAAHLDMLIGHSLDMLTRSAREIPDPERQLWRRIKET